TESLPVVSVVIPSLNQAGYLTQALDSVCGEGYPRLEIIVIDGGSTDGTVEILDRYSDRLTYWVSEPDGGPAQAINKGLARAKGEVVAWLSSDDAYVPGALWEAARLFAASPDLDLVYGNALYVDEHNRPYLADHGSHRTSLYYGKMQPAEVIPMYWSYTHAVPQPTVFFRRRLLDSCGYLNETYQYIFDFELFYRFIQKAKVYKLERTQAYYRVHSDSRTSGWNRFLVELYRFSRPLWPSIFSRDFRKVLRSYVKNYLGRRCGGAPKHAGWWATAARVTL